MEKRSFLPFAMLLWAFLGIAILVLPAVFKAPPAPFVELSPRARQVVLVITSSPLSAVAAVSRFERHDDKWHSVDKAPWLGNVGTGGVNFKKREGDKKTPAGVFHLGTKWSYSGNDTNGRDDVFPIYSETSCITDTGSSLYNRLLQNTQRHAKDWDRSERMLRDDDAYSRLVEVDFNRHPVRPGAGSCIFLHVQTGYLAATNGSISLSAEHMDTLMRWLTADAYPHVIIMTRDEYARQAGRDGSNFPPAKLTAPFMPFVGE